MFCQVGGRPAIRKGCGAWSSSAAIHAATLSSPGKAAVSRAVATLFLIPSPCSHCRAAASRHISLSCSLPAQPRIRISGTASVQLLDGSRPPLTSDTSVRKSSSAVAPFRTATSMAAITISAAIEPRAFAVSSGRAGSAGQPRVSASSAAARVVARWLDFAAVSRRSFSCPSPL